MASPTAQVGPKDRVFEFPPIELSNMSPLLYQYLLANHRSIFDLKWETKAQITSNQNDYKLGQGIAFRLTSDASRNITGLAGGYQGRYLILCSVGTNDIVLKHQDSNSVAANRILSNTGSDVTLTDNQSSRLLYDNTSARWRVIS